jgi:hypothetical protein
MVTLEELKLKEASMTRRNALIVPVLFGLTLTTGCVDSFGAFYISQAMVADIDCVAPAPVIGGSTTAGAFLGGGVLDVSGKMGYLLFPQLENHLPSSTGAGLESNNILVREFKVELDLSNIPGSYASNLTKFSIPKTAMLAPANASVFVLDGVIPDDLVIALSSVVPGGTFRTTIIANLTAAGLRNGDGINSPTFPFPIKVCNGCLIDLRATCPPKSTSGAAADYYSNRCGRPQDSAVTCCPTQGGGIACMQSSD